MKYVFDPIKAQHRKSQQLRWKMPDDDLSRRSWAAGF